MKSSKANKFVFAVVACLLLLGGGSFVVTKLLSSSAARQQGHATAPLSNLDSTKRAAKLGQVAGPATQFSQGTAIELLGISDASADPSRWWAADGTAVSPPANHSTGHDRAKEKRLFQVVLRRIDPPEVGNAIMFVMLAGALHTGVSSRTESHIKGDVDVEVETYTFTLAEAPQTTNLHVSFAAGPWVKDERYALPDASVSATTSHPTTTAVTSAPARDLKITRATDGKDGLEVAIEWAPGVQQDLLLDDHPLQDEFEIVTRDGHEFSPIRMITEKDIWWPVMGFDVRRADALELRHRSRPYEQWEIRDVSLAPGVKTNPTVGVPTYAAATKQLPEETTISVDRIEQEDGGAKRGHQ